MQYLEIYKNKPGSPFNYTVLKGDELYEVKVIQGEKMQWRFLGKVDRNKYQVNGTLVHKPSKTMVIIFQKNLHPLVKESEFKGYNEWINEKFEENTDPIKDLNIGIPFVLKEITDLAKREGWFPDQSDFLWICSFAKRYDLVKFLLDLKVYSNEQIEETKRELRIKLKVDSDFIPKESAKEYEKIIDLLIDYQKRKIFSSTPCSDSTLNMYLNEKFSEDSDPIHDLGIGITGENLKQYFYDLLEDLRLLDDSLSGIITNLNVADENSLRIDFRKSNVEFKNKYEREKIKEYLHKLIEQSGSDIFFIKPYRHKISNKSNERPSIYVKYKPEYVGKFVALFTYNRSTRFVKEKSKRNYNFN